MSSINISTRLLLSLVMMSSISLCPVSAAEPLDWVNVHTWMTKSTPDFFPEKDDPRVSVPWLKNRSSFGIAFSGGGTRSAAATLGELRALNKLGWIRKARYISANSGGSWTVQPFIYLPENIPDEVFLGRYVPPEAINDRMLGPSSKEDSLSMSSAIYRSTVWKSISLLKKGDEAYSNVIGYIFLRLFGLYNPDKVFTFHKKALKAVLSVNKDLTEDNFYTVPRQRPYPIIVGSLRVPVHAKEKQSELFLVEATPLYTGVRNEFRVPIGRRSKEILIGGGYVESFGYDSYAPKGENSKDGLWHVRLLGKGAKKWVNRNHYRFSLADVIGMSGAAPSITLSDKHLHFDVFPEFRYWAIDRKKVLSDKKLRNKAKELKHGDGGDIDNLAVMPLLTRKVENILVFINTRTAFPKSADCNHVTKNVMVDDLISLFQPIGKVTGNVVIDDQDGNSLKTLCEEFSKRKNSGKPLVYCDQYSIKDNHRLAVLGGGYRPTICWVYLDRSDAWIAKIDVGGGKKTRDLLQRHGDFDTFPHYKTFNEKKGLLIDLDRERVHALSNLTAWSVLSSSEYLATKLAGASLPEKLTAPHPEP